MDYDAINKPLKYKSGLYTDPDGDLKLSIFPTVTFKNNFILVKISAGVKYKPVKGMREILESTYERLEKMK